MSENNLHTNNNLDDNRSNAKELLISTIFMLPLISGFLSEIFNLFNKNFPTSIIYFIVFSLALLSWIICAYERFFPVIITLVLSAILILFSLFQTPEAKDYIFDFGNGTLYEIAQSNILTIFGLCIPLLLLSFCHISVGTLYRYMYRYSAVSVGLFVLLMILQIFFVQSKLNYMTVAYNALPGIAVLFYDSRENHRSLSTVLWLFGFAGILLGGCRGALLTLIVLIVLWEMRSLKKADSTTILKIAFVTVVLVIVILNLTSIAEALDDFLGGFGYSSRLISKLLGTSSDGDLFIYSDRERIQQIFIENLDFFGHGILSDRLLAEGGYPHNIILEILYQFGYLYGFSLMLILLVFLVRSHYAARKSGESFLVFSWLVLLCTICVKLMFSASYLTDRTFWMFLGLAVIPFYVKIIPSEDTEIETIA